MLDRSTFRFLNSERKLGWGESWRVPDESLLWAYNLHYFDDLKATDAPIRESWHRELIDRWISENPPGAAPGWDPYPTSLRVVNWIFWALRGNELKPSETQSLALQTAHLEQRIEWHLLGNHLLANAKALIVAGCFFKGQAADRWLEKGVRILRVQLDEQILPDGGHFECSPMYHAILLEDFLDLLNIDRAYPGRIPTGLRQQLQQVAARMRRWLDILRHSDGGIPFFNDAAFGIAAEPGSLARYAEQLGVTELDSGPTGLSQSAGVRYWCFPQTGYQRVDSGRFRILLDTAPIGPDYLPGHAHADTLGFELSFGNQRVFVNGGTSTYEIGEERSRQRGTSSHNTVVVDGEDSSEVWASFRVGRRARVNQIEHRVEEHTVVVSASHDGYRPRLHDRTWRITADEIVVEDQIRGPYRSAQARFQLHPECAIERTAADGYAIRSSDGELTVHVETGSHHLDSSKWHPEFGLSIDTRVLVVDLQAGASRVSIRAHPVSDG